MPEAHCITLSDSDDDALEILEEKISNYGSCSALGSKPIEVTKDIEKTTLDFLRKQNVSIPEGNFRLKIYAKNGGNIDLSALDLLATMSSSLLKVNNKVLTNGKVSYVVSVPPSNLRITEKEEINKENDKSGTIPFDEARKKKKGSKKKASKLSYNKYVRTKVNITKSKFGEFKCKVRETKSKSVTNQVYSKSTKSSEKSVRINTVAVARPVGTCQILDKKDVDDNAKNVVASEIVQMYNMVRGKPITKPCSQVSETVDDNEARPHEFRKFSAMSKVKVHKDRVSNTSKHVIEEQLSSRGSLIKDQREYAGEHNSIMANQNKARRTSFNIESIPINKPVNQEETIDSSTEEMCSHSDSRPATKIDTYICGEAGLNIEALTPDSDLGYDVIDTDTLMVAVEPNNESTDSTDTNFNSLENPSSAPQCRFSEDSGIIKLAETSNYRKDPAPNIATVLVSMKNIPGDSIPESLPRLDHEMNKSGAKYSSTVTLLPSSGPQDFLWQLNSQDFSSMFGLCTHSQADQIRAKLSAPPTSLRLRRVNLNKSVNYNRSGSVKKRR